MPSITSASKKPFDNVIEQKDEEDAPAKITYISSDNQNKEKVLDTLTRLPVIGQVMLAVTWFFPLNMLAVRGKQLPTHKKIEWLILVGIEPGRELVWKKLNKIVCENTDNIIAKNKIIEFMNKYKNILFSENFLPSDIKERMMNQECETQIKELESECSSGSSWLATPEKYSYIRDNYFLNGRICVKTLDLTKASCTTSLVDSLHGLGLKFDTIYLSNIPAYVYFAGKTKELREAFSKLIPATTSETLLIDTKPFSEEDVQLKNPLCALRVRRKIPGSLLKDIIPEHPSIKCLKK